jgi:hypothetical protein
VSGGRYCDFKKQGDTSGGESLTTRQHLGKGTSGGDGAAEKIDAGRRASVAVRVWPGPAGKEKAPGAGSLCRRSGRREKMR